MGRRGAGEGVNGNSAFLGQQDVFKAFPKAT